MANGHFYALRWVRKVFVNYEMLLMLDSYVLMQIPSNMLMASGWIRPSMYMGLCMCLWAIVSACTALVTNYTGLVLIRLALGVTEAPFCKFSSILVE